MVIVVATRLIYVHSAVIETHQEVNLSTNFHVDSVLQFLTEEALDQTFSCPGITVHWLLDRPVSFSMVQA